MWLDIITNATILFLDLHINPEMSLLSMKIIFY